MDDATQEMTQHSIGAACAAAASALLDVRDLLAQAVGYCVLLEDEGAEAGAAKGASLLAALQQTQAIYDFVSTHVPPGIDESDTLEGP